MLRILIVLFCSYLTSDVQAEDRWPGFLGQGATKVEAEGLPVKWSPQENIAWQVALPGHGQSSPVIWGDKVIVTSVEGTMKEQLHLICLSLKTGKIEWQVKRVSSNQEKSSVYISRAAPTPVVDAQHIFAYFEGGDIVACNHQGELKWEVSLAEKYGKPKNEFGLSGSLLQDQERIYVLVDDMGPAYLLALNKADGSIAWKSDRSSRKSWSSPMLLDVNGETQIIVSSDGSIDGYEPGTGKQLWSYTEIAGNTGTSPIDVGNGQFLVGASPGREGQNAEGAKKSNGLYTLSKTDSGFKLSKTWFTEEAVPSWASPIMHVGYAYWINRSGVLYCFDAKTGEKQFAQRLTQGAWATPFACGDRIYIFGKDGLTTIIAAGKEFKLIAENQLWDPAHPPVDISLTGIEETDPQRKAASAMFSKTTLYGAAIVPGHIVLRTGTMLYSVTAPAATK